MDGHLRHLLGTPSPAALKAPRNATRRDTPRAPARFLNSQSRSTTGTAISHSRETTPCSRAFAALGPPATAPCASNRRRTFRPSPRTFRSSSFIESHIHGTETGRQRVGLVGNHVDHAADAQVIAHALDLGGGTARLREDARGFGTDLRQRGPRRSIFAPGILPGHRGRSLSPARSIVEHGPTEIARLGKIGFVCTPRITSLRQIIGTGGKCHQHKCKSETKRFQFTTSLLFKRRRHFLLTRPSCATNAAHRVLHAMHMGPENFAFEAKKGLAPLFLEKRRICTSRKRFMSSSKSRICKALTTLVETSLCSTS